jgi:hypothetical protein
MAIGYAWETKNSSCGRAQYRRFQLWRPPGEPQKMPVTSLRPVFHAEAARKQAKRRQLGLRSLALGLKIVVCSI